VPGAGHFTQEETPAGTWRLIAGFAGPVTGFNGPATGFNGPAAP
jgi:hypothetical protein